MQQETIKKFEAESEGEAGDSVLLDGWNGWLNDNYPPSPGGSDYWLFLLLLWLLTWR